MNEQLTHADRAILADEHWREKLNQSALAALVAAGAHIPPIRGVFAKLMARVPAGGGEDAYSGLRGVIATMVAFSNLPVADRDALAGRFPAADVFGLSPFEQLTFRLSRQREVFRSSPTLEAAWQDMEADEAKEREERERDEAALQAKEDAKERRMLEVAEAVADMHRRGIRFQVFSEGRVRAWPGSLLNEADTNLVLHHPAELAEAITADWIG